MDLDAIITLHAYDRSLAHLWQIALNAHISIKETDRLSMCVRVCMLSSKTPKGRMERERKK